MSRVIARRKKERVVKGTSFGLHPRIRRILYRAIAAGISYKRSCEMCGIPYRNFEFWMNKGKEKKEGNEIYIAFRKYIRRIEARQEKELLAVIDKVARGNFKITEVEVIIDAQKNRTTKRKVKQPRPEWKAAAWRLEKKFPDDYAPRLPEFMQSKSPEEIAREIKEASDKLYSSIPTGEE